MNVRQESMTRETRETRITATLNLDGSGNADVRTGIGFLDHMLTALSRHARFDLTLACEGDLEVDDHHTAEDCAIVLGSLFGKALGDKAGITRFGSAYAPLDEALARAVVDLSGRPWPETHLALRREAIGDIATENITHFFNTFAIEARASIHVDVLRGENDHHRAEAAFKALAIALRGACRRDGSSTVPSTKGTLG
jgi:imidazoleglycerol phosphate dehydratase HisB